MIRCSECGAWMIEGMQLIIQGGDGAEALCGEDAERVKWYGEADVMVLN